MRYLTLAEAITIAEVVTGTNAAVLARASRLDLLDSALHAPQAGFGDVEFYPDFGDPIEITHRVIQTRDPFPMLPRIGQRVARRLASHLRPIRTNQGTQEARLYILDESSELLFHFSRLHDTDILTPQQTIETPNLGDTQRPSSGPNGSSKPGQQPAKPSRGNRAVGADPRLVTGRVPA